MRKSIFRVVIIGLLLIYCKINVIINIINLILLRSGWGLKTSWMVNFGLEFAPQSCRESTLILFIYLLRLGDQIRKEEAVVIRIRSTGNRI